MERRKQMPTRVRTLNLGAGRKTWILLFNRTRAKLIEYSGLGRQLKNIGGYVNPEGELQNKELVTDRPGRVHRLSVGGGRHPAPASEQAHEHALTLFARELAAVLEMGLKTAKCERIVIAAEPHCLGKIKKVLSPKAKKKIHGTVHKDVLRLSSAELFSSLAETLR